MIYLRFSPALSMEQNLLFQKDVEIALQDKGYGIGGPALFPMEPGWPIANRTLTNRSYYSKRLLLALLASVAAPIICYWTLQRSPTVTPLMGYIALVSVMIAAGTAIHGLGSFPDTVVGLSAFKGVKLQLVLPVAGCLWALLTKEEIHNLLNQSIRVKHLIGIGAIGAAAAALYLMRSGNFPLVPVSASERRLRDVLEHAFTVRPRFKEFLIGHPLLITGLYIRARHPERLKFINDGRLLIWLGSIGLISILNTFSHFAASYGSAVLRTVHGVWIGGLIGLVLCYLSDCRRASA
jgi:hypothetical protein